MTPIKQVGTRTVCIKVNLNLLQKAFYDIENRNSVLVDLFNEIRNLKLDKINHPESELFLFIKDTDVIQIQRLGRFPISLVTQLVIKKIFWISYILGCYYKIIELVMTAFQKKEYILI